MKRITGWQVMKDYMDENTLISPDRDSRDTEGEWYWTVTESEYEIIKTYISSIHYKVSDV